MSESAKKKWASPKGKELKRKLSKLTSKKHALNKFENTKRQGWYPSNKMNKWVFYGSSYELRLCWILDHDDNVEEYETQIGYNVNGRGRCLDCLVKYKEDNDKLAIEVKPKSRLNEQASIEQIADSSAHAKQMGYKFKVYTEDDLGLSERELRKWADELRKEITGIDYVEHRMELDRKKAKKHYDSKIATDKVDVECKFCNETHKVLRKSYDDNIARNGRYICGKEGGHIAGKKPKKKKVNPYAADGKKLCTGPCGEVKPFSEFGVDKSRSDGYSSRCKECRKNASREAYNRKKK